MGCDSVLEHFSPKTSPVTDCCSEDPWKLVLRLLPKNDILKVTLAASLPWI